VLKRIVYFALILGVALGTIKLYALWWERHESLNPQVVSAAPYVYTERLPVRGVLFWQEERLASRWDGTVTYPSAEPRRVAKGETVAVVSGPSGKMAVKSPRVGYFVAGLDGAEGKWNYSSFWSDRTSLPDVPAFVPIAPGSAVKKGGAVGKLILQPQELRGIFYADGTPGLFRDIKAGYVRVRLREKEWPQRADVRVHEAVGQKVRLYLTLPFFPPELALSRGFSMILEGGERSGVAVPETAVTYRDGKLGVYQVEGNVVTFRSVEGLPVEGHRFFVTSGLSSGNVVLLEAQKGKEGKIRLW
jgi:hypothetical protein